MATIVDIFDAVRDGTYADFETRYNGEPNQVDKALGTNLLQMAVTNDKNPEDKVKIIERLLRDGADVGWHENRRNRNALHTLFFCIFRPAPGYFETVVALLIDWGIDVNLQDRYGAIPLKYSLTLTKLPTEQMRDVYRLLLKSGSDYSRKDAFGKTCIDYANEYPWRNDFVRIVNEYKKYRQ